MMGTFFMGNALGNLIAGLTAGSFSTMPLPVLFGTIGKVTGVAGLILLLFSGTIRKRLIGVLPSQMPPKPGETEVHA
jgi:POT family proton-dependent oligopeptide transporter